MYNTKTQSFINGATNSNLPSRKRHFRLLRCAAQGDGRRVPAGAHRGQLSAELEPVPEPLRAGRVPAAPGHVLRRDRQQYPKTPKPHEFFEFD